MLLLEKLSPALRHIDSSSGALGNAEQQRTGEHRFTKKWLARLFQAIQQADFPHIGSLGDHWGELCATPELASDWSDSCCPASTTC